MSAWILVVLAELIGLALPDDRRQVEPESRVAKAIPIPERVPTGDPTSPAVLSADIGLGPAWRGSTVRVGLYKGDGVWSEWRLGRLRGHRKVSRVAEGEFARFSEVQRFGGAIGFRSLFYLGSSMDARIEGELSPRGVQFTVSMTYWVMHGVSIGLCWEPLTGRPFVRFEYAFEDLFELVAYCWLNGLPNPFALQHLRD